MLDEKSKPTGMRQPRPSGIDMRALRCLLIALEQADFGVIPARVGSKAKGFIENDADKVAAFNAIVSVFRHRGPAAVGRCVWALDLILDPASRVINPDSDIVEYHPDIQQAFDIVRRLAAAARSSDIAAIQQDAENLCAKLKKGGA